MTLLHVPGASLFLHQVGPRDAPAVVLVHGGPGESHDYLRPFFDCLASNERCVVYYDQRGAGKSPIDPHSSYGDWQTHVRDLEAIRTHLGQERLTLVGFSWGALLSLLHALEHPNRVERLILVCPVPIHADAMKTVAQNLARSAARPEVIRLQHRIATDPEKAKHAPFLFKVAACLFDPSAALLLAPVETNDDAANVVMQSLGDFDLRPRLEGLSTVVTAVIYGKEDPVSAHHAPQTARDLSASCIAIDSCGHAPFVEAPEVFLAHLRRALDNVDYPSIVR